LWGTHIGDREHALESLGQRCANLDAGAAECRLTIRVLQSTSLLQSSLYCSICRSSTSIFPWLHRWEMISKPSRVDARFHAEERMNWKAVDAIDFSANRN